ncbi:hypothetical protein NC653_005415 [Populus alba x Populus x berolinensis]|uniref:Uncharacterized protein n=1 Tax=Populus alba x Populus x berolinensis TaxID=444605 RepID=A0AAD6RBT1_9ROSI|nr:hypothetical protein NC653_005415 [Populus alba x Populus x berolinensis]
MEQLHSTITSLGFRLRSVGHYLGASVASFFTSNHAPFKKMTFLHRLSARFSGRNFRNEILSN